MAKNTVEKTIDFLLMAPHKNTDCLGNDPHKHPLNNFLNQPFVKVSVPLTMLFATATMVKEPNTALAVQHLTVGIGMVAFQQLARPFIQSSRMKNLYFDTSPDAHKSISAENALEIMQEKKRSVFSLTVSSLFFAAATIHLSPSVALCGYIPVLMDNIFHCWRADQVLKGNWAVETEKPQKEEKLSTVPGKLMAHPLHQ